MTSLLLDEYKRTGGIDLNRLYKRRIRWIFPAYYVFLAAVGVLAISGVLHVPFLGWVLSALYLTDYAFSDTAVWIVHSWSLSVEEQFYLFWPALIMLLDITRAKNFAFAIIVALPACASVPTCCFLIFATPSMRCSTRVSTCSCTVPRFRSAFHSVGRCSNA